MLIDIRHTTTYSYATPALYSVRRLRLTPPTFEGQTIVSWSIAAPGIGKALAFHDGFGNLAHLASLTGTHDAVVITASGCVETTDHCGIVRGLADPAPRR